MKIYREEDDIVIEPKNEREDELFQEFICSIYEDTKEIVVQEIFDLVENDTKEKKIIEPTKVNKYIDKVIFNNPTTVVLWKDGTKTVSKAHNGDVFDKEKGLAMCVIRKLCRNRNYDKVFATWCS